MKRIPELEGVRGLLALMVVLGHSLVSGPYQLDSLPLPLQWLGNGGFAVQLFIVLSGFVIFLLLDQSHERYDQFIVRRACRLFPVYWVCLAISVLMVPMSIAAMERLPWCEQAFKARLNIFHETNEHWTGHLLAHITLLHGAVPNAILPRTAFAFIGQAWSVSVEWQFYLIAPFIYSMGKSKRSLVVAVLAVALVAAQRWLSYQNACVFAQTHLFAFGACGYFAYREILCRREQLANHRTLVTLAPIALTFLFRGQPAMIGFAFVLSLIAGVELMPKNRIVSACSRLLSSRPAIYLGRISYCVYLSHMIAHYALLSALTPFASQPVAFLWLHAVGSILGSIAISIPLSHWVEYPAIDLGRFISQKLGDHARRRRLRREARLSDMRPATA
jgi:peptidoglycan/LPS O-acetylase OafA/YrhL